MTAAQDRAAMLAKLDAIQIGVDSIVADQQAAVAAAVAAQAATDAETLAEQRRLDDLVIEGQQSAIESLTRQVDDQKKTMDLQAHTIEEQAAEIERLQKIIDGEDPPPPPPTGPLWGFNVGGYATLGEEPTDAWARIVASFGKVNVVRWWANWFFDWADIPKHWGDTPVAPNLGSDVAGVLAGKYDDRMRFICEQATRRTLLTFAHEPEDNVFGAREFTVADWQAAQTRLAGIKASVGNPLVTFGPLLMGATYHATRYKGSAPGNIPASQWLDFDRTNIDTIGADLYMWGTTDATADHAETVIGPVRDLALSYGKTILVGELGARRRSTVSDAIRKRWIDETAAIVTANPDLFAAICYYETDRGAGDKVPWNLLPPPGQDPADPANSPLAVAAYRGLCEE